MNWKAGLFFVMLVLLPKEKGEELATIVMKGGMKKAPEKGALKKGVASFMKEGLVRLKPNLVY